MKKWLRKILIEEWVALAGLLILLTVNTVFFDFNSISQTFLLIFRYLTFGEPIYALFFLFIYFLFFWKFYWRLADLSSQRLIGNKKLPFGSVKSLWLLFISPFRFLLPIVAVVAPFSILLGNLNYALRFSGRDEALAIWDKAITGVIPFISLANAFPSTLITLILKYSYISLAGVMSLTLILLFIFSKKKLLYRQGVLAFILSLLLSFPFFVAVPCQDPYNYFTRNLRGGEISSVMKAEMAKYNPSYLTILEMTKIADAETSPAMDNAVPVSCFPSMHAVWTLLTIYFLYCLWPLSLIGSVPWLILSLGGGVYFGQHYFVDYLFGAVIFGLCILISRFLLRLERRWQKQ